MQSDGFLGRFEAAHRTLVGREYGGRNLSRTADQPLANIGLSDCVITTGGWVISRLLSRLLAVRRKSVARTTRNIRIHPQRSGDVPPNGKRAVVVETATSGKKRRVASGDAISDNRMRRGGSPLFPAIPSPRSTDVGVYARPALFSAAFVAPSDRAHQHAHSRCLPVHRDQSQLTLSAYRQGRGRDRQDGRRHARSH